MAPLRQDANNLWQAGGGVERVLPLLQLTLSMAGQGLQQRRG
jgi:hypothetical protein